MIITAALVLEVHDPNAGTPIEDSTEWKTLLAAATEQTRRAVYAGRSEEEPNKLWRISDWPTLEGWRNDSHVQQALGSLITSGLATQASLFTVALLSEDRKALDAPTTEISIGFVQPGSDAAIRLQQARSIFIQKAAAAEIPNWGVGVVSGWTFEKDLDFTTLRGRKSTGRGYFSLLGWESKEAHERFPETSIGVEDIMSAGAEGWFVAHVRFRQL